MARDITITFEDGSTHVYKGAPDTITPDAVQKRAESEFGKSVTGIDGGKNAAPTTPVAPIQPKQEDKPWASGFDVANIAGGIVYI